MKSSVRNLWKRKVHKELIHVMTDKFPTTKNMLLDVTVTLHEISEDLEWPGPILEFKGSVWYVQKGHPNMATQADMILQNWWEFKVLWQLVALYTRSWSIVLFTVLFPVGEFYYPSNSRKINYLIFTLLQ